MLKVKVNNMDDKLVVGVSNSIEYMRNLTTPINPDMMLTLPIQNIIGKKLADYSNEELLEEIKQLNKRIEALEKMVKFHEAIRRR